MPHGVPITSPPFSPDLARVLSQLGDANVAERGLTLGGHSDGALAGRIDAIRAIKPLSTGMVEVEVAHALGRVPVEVVAWEVEAGPSNDLVLVVSAVKKSLWTATTVRVKVHAVAGSMTGAKLTLLIA